MKNIIIIKANGNISNLIQHFNKNINVLEELKIKTLEPSEDENIRIKNVLMYDSLKEELKDILKEIAFINENYFLGILTEYVAILFEKLFHIIDMN